MSEPSTQWLEWARELSAIGRSGKHYNTNPAFSGNAYDAERYDAVERIASEMLAAGFGVQVDAARLALGPDQGHITPKIDVRGALFESDHVLLVQERLDGMRWTLPGGWVDVSDSPSSAVEREFSEETGRSIRATRLLAVFDRRTHNFPPAVHGTFKMMFAVEATGGEFLNTTLETVAPTLWPLSDLPELSTGRVTAEQLRVLHDVHRDPSRQTYFD